MRAQLQGLLLGGASAAALAVWVSGSTRADSVSIGQRLAARSSSQTAGAAVSKAPVPVQLASGSAPAWSAETKTEAVRAWNDRVRQWHRQLSKTLF